MKKAITNKLLWLFAIGQLGWSMLSALIANWLVYIYQPDAANVAAGQTLFIPQGRVIFGAITIIGGITALGRIFDAVTDPWIANLSDNCRKNPRGRRIPFMRAHRGAVRRSSRSLVFWSPGERHLRLERRVAAHLAAAVLSVHHHLLHAVQRADPGARPNAERPHQHFHLSSPSPISSAAPSAYLVPNIAGFWSRASATRERYRAASLPASRSWPSCACSCRCSRSTSRTTSTRPRATRRLRLAEKTFRNRDFRTFLWSDVSYWIALTIFQTGLSYYIVSC
jgi:GPH family glycoside/pentoside/hexuronide:cation symporter